MPRASGLLRVEVVQILAFTFSGFWVRRQATAILGVIKTTKGHSKLSNHISQTQHDETKIGPAEAAPNTPSLFSPKPKNPRGFGFE